MKVLASASFDGEKHLLTNQSQLEFAAVDVRTRASSSARGTSSILYVPALTFLLYLGMSPLRGPQALSQLPSVTSSRCMVSTWSNPPPQSM
jgi:hypothetical protein